MDMLWWHWIAFGLVLAGFEMLTPGGFFVLFFGVGAVAVGLLALVGLAGPLWVQWLLFTVLSVSALLVFRRPLLHWMRTREDHGPIDALVGEVAVPVADIEPGAVGRVELRGTGWQARNVSSAVTTRGQRCRVNRVDGLTLEIKPEGGRHSWVP